MKSPSKITCFSRPARGKGGGVEVCRQGHALWLGDHYDLDQFNHWKESKKKPMAVLAAKRSSRQTKKASKAGTGAASQVQVVMVLHLQIQVGLLLHLQVQKVQVQVLLCPLQVLRKGFWNALWKILSV